MRPLPQRLEIEPLSADRFLSAANMFLDRLNLEFGLQERITAHAFDACLANMDKSQETLSATEPPYRRKVLLASSSRLYSLVAITWPPGARTPIHSHYTWCTFLIAEGVLTERRFAAPSRGAPPHLAASATLASGEIRVDERFGGIHQLANDSDRRAISLHCYGVDAAQAATHVNRVFE